MTWSSATPQNSQLLAGQIQLWVDFIQFGLRLVFQTVFHTHTVDWRLHFGKCRANCFVCVITTDIKVQHCWMPPMPPATAQRRQCDEFLNLLLNVFGRFEFRWNCYARPSKLHTTHSKFSCICLNFFFPPLIFHLAEEWEVEVRFGVSNSINLLFCLTVVRILANWVLSGSNELLFFFLFFTFSPCLACFRFVWFPRSFPLFRAVSLVGLWQISLKYCWNNFGRLSLWLVEFLNSQRFRFCALCVCPKKVRWVIFFAFMFFKNGLYSFHSHSLSENYVSFNLLHWIK